MAEALAENIAHFARALRVAGLPVGPGTVLDAIAAVEAAGIGSRDDFYWTLHAVFVRRHEQSVTFRTAFEIFWKRRHLMEKLLSILMPVAPAAPGKPDPVSLRLQEAFFKQAESVPVEKPEIEVDASLTVSDIEVLQKKDFAQMTAAEIAEANRRVAALVLPDDAVPTRRLAPDPRGPRIDLRRTLRRSIAEGGAIIDLARRGPKTKHPPLVILCDISGSMSQYSRVILHFAHALMERRRHVHVFTFGTRLTNVTRMLRAKDPDEALAACTAAVDDWSGGTRIAPSIHAFNRLWSRRVLAGGAVVLLATDGLERDGTADLAREADRLHRSCRRLVWLNPLLRFDGFEARAQGIRALLPHVDEFRTIHNVAAVSELVAALDARRPDRSHDPRLWLKVA
ncbi:VWA domain-containing protein [Phreatobacter sp.]|uniref:vWA domain-containing protein n=1 Tax=Phreatobacter sp. TaxID=1966341 RepID=UPI0022C23179|nr:VWA domain-containing protein [Phreatobacter sp.]MCZ8314436.1 VWA domain-containing protein [Phreatobacter sp.]